MVIFKGYLKKIFSFFSLIVSAFFFALSLHIFTIPAKIAPGGVSGIASILEIVINFPAGYSLFCLNLPILFLSFFFLKKLFILKSFLVVIVSSLTLALLRKYSFYQFIVDDPMLPAIAGALLNGASAGMILLLGGSTAGMDIIGLIIQKRCNGLYLSRILLFINLAIIIMGGILYRVVLKLDVTHILELMIYSLMHIFLNTKSLDVVLNGLTSSVKFEVITSKKDQLQEAISRQLGRTVTTIHSKGGYSHVQFHLLICVVSKTQVAPFKRILKEIDPQAFCIALDTKEVLGSGFTSKT